MASVVARARNGGTKLDAQKIGGRVPLSLRWLRHCAIVTVIYIQAFWIMLNLYISDI
jgi:hypothetical protein